MHGWHEPISGLLAGAILAAIAGYVTSFLVVRGSDLTRLMVTLGIGLMLWEAANKAASVTGGVDGLSGVTIDKILGVFGFDIGGRTAFGYALVVVFIVFVVLRRVVHSPFGLSGHGSAMCRESVGVTPQILAAYCWLPWPLKPWFSPDTTGAKG